MLQVRCYKTPFCDTPFGTHLDLTTSHTLHQVNSPHICILNLTNPTHFRVVDLTKHLCSTPLQDTFARHLGNTPLQHTFATHLCVLDLTTHDSVSFISQQRILSRVCERETNSCVCERKAAFVVTCLVTERERGNPKDMYREREEAHPKDTLSYPTTLCNTLQHTATPCGTLQHPAAHCCTLSHSAAQCSAVQRRAADSTRECWARTCFVAYAYRQKSVGQGHVLLPTHIDFKALDLRVLARW